MAPAVGDQVGHRDHLQLVASTVGDQIGDARHRAVVVHHLADHTGRIQAGQSREIHRGLGLPSPLQHAAGAALERKHVARLDKIPRGALRVDRDLDRVGAIVSGDACRDALSRLHGHRERRFKGRLVLGGHQVEPELVAAL